MKQKLCPDGSSSDFFIDKVLRDRVRRQLSRIQSELSIISSSIPLTNEDIEAVSSKLPVDMADLNKLFAKTWCDKYGSVVLDLVRKEFKYHMGDLSRAKEGRRRSMCENNENRRPN